MRGNFFGLNSAQIAHPAAGVFPGIAVQHLAPVSAVRCAYTVSNARNWSEIADHKNGVLRCLTLPQQGDGAGGVVVGVHPFESCGVVVQHVHGRLTAVKAVQLLDPGLYSPMNLVLEDMPFEAGVMAPFANLSEFCSHEQEFL